jgi:hypothetical protein
MSQIFRHCDKYYSFCGKIFNGQNTQNPILSSCQKIKCVQMNIKLCSSDAISPSHFKMVKNFITYAEMT